MLGLAARARAGVGGGAAPRCSRGSARAVPGRARAGSAASGDAVPLRLPTAALHADSITSAATAATDDLILNVPSPEVAPP